VRPGRHVANPIVGLGVLAHAQCGRVDLGGIDAALGDQGVGVDPQLLDDFVLQESVDEDHLGPQELLPAGDLLDDRFPMVDDELKVEIRDPDAGVAVAGRRLADVAPGTRGSMARPSGASIQCRGALRARRRRAREILTLGEREGDARMLINGHLVLGSTVTFIDDLQGGLGHLDQAISLFAAGPARARTAGVGNDPRVACYTTSGLTLWLLGFPDRAVERMDAALALAVELEHPFTAAYARFHSGLLHHWRREPDIVLDRAAGLLEIADEHDFRIWTAAGGCLLGAAQVGLGRFDEGLANIRKGTDLYQGLRSPPAFWPMLLFIDAGASYQSGQFAAGLGPIDAAIEIMSPGAGTTLLPELHLLKGDLLAALEAEEGRGPSGAETWYRLALDRAGELKSRMTQLRAATRLARLWQANGEPEAATRTLAPVYATFTEGFSTADLIEAKDVLAAVAPSRASAT